MVKQLFVVENVLEKVENDYEFGTSEPVWILTLFKLIYITKMWCSDARCNVYSISWIGRKGRVRTINFTAILHFMICLAVFFGAIIISGYLGS